MAVIRHGPAPEDHYSLIPNDLARSTEISLQAKGLYLYLRSHREGWEMSTERIGEVLGIHRDTVSKYVRELENLGYLDRQKVFDESGHFAGIAYILSSEPLLKNTVNGKTPDAEKHRTRKNTVSGDLRQHKKTNSSKKLKISRRLFVHLTANRVFSMIFGELIPVKATRLKLRKAGVKLSRMRVPK